MAMFGLIVSGRIVSKNTKSCVTKFHQFCPLWALQRNYRFESCWFRRIPYLTVQLPALKYHKVKAFIATTIVQTEFQQINERQCVTTIQDADNINHIVLFLTGNIPFPEGTAGQVYFSWPDPNAPPNWLLLGYISNDKPSAIFKVSNLKRLHEMGDYSNMMFGQSHIVHNAQIGISIEPLSNIQEVLSPESSEMQVTFAQKMLKSFMDYVLSYTITQTNMVPDPTATYVPLSTVQNWYTNFERRLALHPNFWKS